MEFIANSEPTTIAFKQSEPAIAATRNGGFVVTWRDNLSSAAQGDIKAQRFNSSGTRVGGEVLINQSIIAGTQRHPDVVFLSLPPAIAHGRPSLRDVWIYDRLVFAWVDDSHVNDSSNQSSDIWVSIWCPTEPIVHPTTRQRIGFSGLERRTQDVAVNDYVWSTQDYPAVADSGRGTYVVAWEDWFEHRPASSRPGGEDLGVLARRGDTLGNLSHEFKVNDLSRNTQHQVSMGTGKSTILFTFTNHGQAMGSNRSGQADILGSIATFGAGQGLNPLVAADFTLNLVARNGSPGQDQQLNAASVGLGDRFATIAETGDRFVTVFETDHKLGNQFTSETDIHGVLVANGVPVNEFIIASNEAGYQTKPSIAVLRDEKGTFGFVVAWENYLASSAGGTGTSEVYARVFDVEGVPISPDFRVNDNTLGGQGEPDVAGLTDGRYVVTWFDERSNAGDIKFKILEPWQ